MGADGVWIGAIGTGCATADTLAISKNQAGSEICLFMVTWGWVFVWCEAHVAASCRNRLHVYPFVAKGVAVCHGR